MAALVYILTFIHSINIYWSPPLCQSILGPEKTSSYPCRAYREVNQLLWYSVNSVLFMMEIRTILGTGVHRQGWLARKVLEWQAIWNWGRKDDSARVAWCGQNGHWLNVDRVGISQIRKSLKLSKGFGTHPRTHRKPLKSFKQGRLHLSESLALRNRDWPNRKAANEKDNG